MFMDTHGWHKVPESYKGYISYTIHVWLIREYFPLFICKHMIKKN